MQSANLGGGRQRCYKQHSLQIYRWAPHTGFTVDKNSKREPKGAGGKKPSFAVRRFSAQSGSSTPCSGVRTSAFRP